VDVAGEHALAARVAFASNAYGNYDNRGSYVTGAILNASLVSVFGRSLKVAWETQKPRCLLAGRVHLLERGILDLVDQSPARAI
jgi:hypothetical protein